MLRILTVAVCLLALASTAALAQAGRPTPGGPDDFDTLQRSWERHQELDDASLFGGLEWRSIGPVVQGGRVVDIESVPSEPYTFYVAYASGGLWKTTTNGVTFEPLFDDQPVQIMGDIAIDPSNPNNVWVGTGENNSSRSSYGGWGVFRSTDGGDSWEHMGLGDTNRIGRVLVDPRDGNRVFVGAVGRLYSEGGQRGLYRTTNGGRDWELVLSTDGDGRTGVIDIVFEPGNPDVIYAATWYRTRTAWNFEEGGDGSGIYKSTDGGDTWTRLSGGFPRGATVGRIGLATTPADPKVVYACLDNQELLPEELWDLGDSPVTPKRLRKMTKEEFLRQDPDAIESFIRGNDLDTELDAKKLIAMIENDELTLDQLLDEVEDANANLFNTDVKSLEVYRSNDRGSTWKRTHDDPIRDVTYSYGYYFGQISVAPDDADRVYTMGVPMITSGDGGKTWSGINGRGVHVDHHELWVDPNFTDRVVAANDGGLDMSYDGGQTWIKLDRQAVGQFYTVHVDMEDPYNVYGGLQDNGTLKGSSRSRPALDAWRVIGGGDGMYVQTDDRDGTTYTGFQFGFYNRAGSGGRASVRPRDGLGEPALRYNWATPILLSHHNQDIVYFGANMLMRSMDRGDTWTAISEDLTRSTNRGDVPFGTITTIAESEQQFGRLYVGTDDGHVWMTPDGGVEWVDLGDGLPRDRWVSRVEASRVETERVYVTLNGYRNDDMDPYLFVRESDGGPWRPLHAGLPAESINVVREDPVNPEVLYVGTDRGVYVSLDRGINWMGLPGDLPNVPVHDLVVHPRERELVVGTHGRSIWILDALPIQEMDAELRAEPVHVFPLESMRYGRGWQGRRSLWFDRESDRPDLSIPFWSGSAGTAYVRILDGDDRELRRFPIEVERGVNTATWDLLLDETAALAAESAKQAKSDDDGEAADDEAAETVDKGALAKTPWAEAVRLGWPLYVTPGTYTIEIAIGEESSSTDFTVDKPRKPEPRAKPKPKIRGEQDDDRASARP